MSFYADIAADALAVLTEFGQSMTHRAIVNGAYDPATSTASATVTDTARIGVIFDYAGAQFVRGTLVEIGDKRIILDNAGAIDPHDRIIVGSDEFAIVSVGEINPAGESVIFDLHVRLS